MNLPSPAAAGDYVLSADQRILMHRVPWSHYEAQLALRGDAPVPRIAYLDGTMELMTPSRDHERIKSYIGALVEAYALERDIDLSPYGAWTIRSAPMASGVEPDECYIIGSDQSKDRPDLAIEVVWTSGGMDKLQTYQRLGVAEVWLWRAGVIEVYVLQPDGSERRQSSACLAGLDLDLLASLLDLPTAMQAVRALRAAI